MPASYQHAYDSGLHVYENTIVSVGEPTCTEIVRQQICCKHKKACGAVDSRTFNLVLGCAKKAALRICFVPIFPSY